MEILKTVLPSFIVALTMFFWQRRQKKRDDDDACRSKDQKEEVMLSLQLQMANARMSYACAMALKNGRMNGELDAAIKDFNKAEKQWNIFMQVQGHEKLMGD